MTRFNKWRRQRRVVRAYKLLKKEWLLHEQAGHDVQFIAVNGSHMSLRCNGCPDYAVLKERQR